MLFRNRTTFTAVAISATLFAAAAGLAAEKEAGVFRISDQSRQSGTVQRAGYESPVFRANWDNDDNECDCDECKKERRHKFFKKLCPFHHHHHHGCGCYSHGGFIGWLFHGHDGCNGGSCRHGKRPVGRPGRVVRRIFGDSDGIDVQYLGVGGEGLFGAGCEFDPYRANCDQTRLARMFHDTACDWNAQVYKKYKEQGTGSGYYRIAYPVNTQHIDPRDGRIYAAQGWGIPMAVPVAPNVTHTYNYGWGVPSSRLSPMSYPAPEVVPTVPAPMSSANQ